nr:thioesterase domain-containing protein [Micromonospora tarapacensis]
MVERLRGDWSVLGVASPALDTTVPVPPTLTELAGGYLDEIRAVLPAGTPVRLVGWSLGAVLAYELGRQLCADGRDCTAVLIDPWVGPAGAPAAPSAGELVRAFLTDVTRGEVTGELPATDTELTAEETLRALWPQVAGSRPDLVSLGLPAALRLFGVFAAHTRALVRYDVPAAPGLDAHLLVARTPLGGAAGGYLVPLGDRLPGPAPRQQVPGDHFAVTDPDKVDAVAAAITAALCPQLP